MIQAVLLFFVLGFRGAQWVTPYLVYFLLIADGHSILGSTAWAAASAVAVLPVLVLLTVGAKWLLLGRVRPGRYPLWGPYYMRWWFVQQLVTALNLDHLGGTPLLPFIFRLLGVHVGKDVHLETENLAAFDLISIGDGTTIDEDASLFGSIVQGEELVLGRVIVGRDCFVGARSILRECTTMEDGARVEDLTFLPRGRRIPHGETWAGSPAQRAPRPATPRPRRTPYSPLRRAAAIVLYLVLALIFPLVLLTAFVPGIALLTWINLFVHPWWYLAAAPAVGASFVLLVTSEVVLLKWLLLGRVRAGTHPVHGSFYIRKWIVDRLLDLSLDVVGQLHATLYLAPWYRALGAKLGKFVELSTASSMTPDLLELADGATVADEVSLGAPHIERGWMTIAPTRLGRRAFVGNSGLIPAGTALGEGSLVGVLSRSPAAPVEAARKGASWLGSPPFLLPRRQQSHSFTEGRTYLPPPKLVRARRAFELLRVTLPAAGFIIVTTTVIEAGIALWSRAGLGAALAFLPLIYAICCAAVVGLSALTKWCVIGEYKPFTKPLWSAFIWRLEFVNALYEFMATPLLLEALQGTPFLPWALRLFGARIGRRVYINTTGFLEWDLLDIGDRAALNHGCVLQTHLFEDRVLKASSLRIGADCVIGAASVVLYDTEMEDGSSLDSLSLLMKGERLPAGTAWAGIPAAWQDAEASERLAKLAG